MPRFIDFLQGFPQSEREDTVSSSEMKKYQQLSKFVKKETGKFYNSKSEKSLFPFSKNDRNRGPAKVKSVPKAVLQVTSIGEMGGFWIIAKENEGRWFNRDLVSEENFEAAMP